MHFERLTRKFVEPVVRHRTLLVVRHYDELDDADLVGALGERSARPLARYSGDTPAPSSQSATGARVTPPWPKTSPASSSSKRGADVNWWCSNNARPCRGCWASRTTRRAMPLDSLRRYSQALRRLDGRRSVPSDDDVIDRIDAETSLNLVNGSPAISRNRNARSCSWSSGVVSVTRRRPWPSASRWGRFVLGCRAPDGSYNYGSATTEYQGGNMNEELLTPGVPDSQRRVDRPTDAAPHRRGVGPVTTSASPTRAHRRRRRHGRRGRRARGTPGSVGDAGLRRMVGPTDDAVLGSTQHRRDRVRGSRITPRHAPGSTAPATLPPLSLSDARGPYSLLVYGATTSPALCVLGNGVSVLHEDGATIGESAAAQ